MTPPAVIVVAVSRYVDLEGADLVRYSLALDFCREAGRLELPTIIVDGSPAEVHFVVKEQFEVLGMDGFT